MIIFGDQPEKLDKQPTCQYIKSAILIHGLQPLMKNLYPGKQGFCAKRSCLIRNKFLQIITLIITAFLQKKK